MAVVHLLLATSVFVRFLCCIKHHGQGALTEEGVRFQRVRVHEGRVSDGGRNS